MSTTHSRNHRWAWLAVAATVLGVGLAGPAHAQSRRERDENYLDKVRRKIEVQAQKMETEVTNALSESRKLGARDPVKAANRLKKALALLEDDQALKETRRSVLARMLRDRIRYWEGKSDRKVRSDAAREDSKERRRLRRLNTDSSGRERVDRTRRTIRDTRNSIDEDRRIRKERTGGTASVMRDIDRSAIPIDGPIVWTKDKKLLAALEKRKTTVKLTKKEIQLLRTLNSIMSVDFKDTTFEGVIDYLQDKTGLAIYVDKEAIKEAGVDYETPITLKIKKAGVRAILRKILNDVGLTYVIKDEAIMVTTLEKARKMMVVRTYPVGDLVVSLDPRVPPNLRQLQTIQNVAALIDLIKTTVEPQSWASEENGGQGGTIVYNAGTMSLVVKQSAEFHYALQGTLRK
jgi:hypothetical protein